MSFTRRIIDGARSGINTVMDRIAADDTPLSHVHEDELHNELEHRKAARMANPAKPTDNPRARMASASDAARALRRKQAEERETRIHAARAKRERAARAAQEQAFRRAKEQARQAASSARQRTYRSTSSSSARSGRTGRSSFRKADSDKIAGFYKVLDLPVGAPFEDVKKSYRKLMRKYHPDRHVGNPKKQKAATELTMRVTQAYKELENHLKGK